MQVRKLSGGLFDSLKQSADEVEDDDGNAKADDNKR